MNGVDLGKYSIEEVRAFWELMARRNPAEKAVVGDQHVIFRLGVGHFAIKAASCGGVVGYRQPSPLPVLPQHVIGVAAIRGRPMSVTDLGVLFGLRPAPKGGHMLLVRADGEETALKVDWVDSVVELDLANLTPPPPKWEGLRTGLVLGAVTYRGTQVIVVDAGRCIKASETA